MRDWVLRRQTDGCYVKLLRELELEVPSLYKNFLRMNALDFNALLSLIEPKIRKQDTVMRDSIPAGERLAITLRFLATGESFKSLQYIFRVPQSTISKIVPEVCDAIYHELKGDFMKVCNFILLLNILQNNNFFTIYRYHQVSKNGHKLQMISIVYGTIRIVLVPWMENTSL